MMCRNMMTAALLFAGLLHAQFPVQDMGSKTLGTSISMAFRGQNITLADVPSHEVMQALNLAYAPVQFALLTGGLGIDRLTVDTHNDTEFDGDFGFSPFAGLHLYTPFLASILRVTGGLALNYLNSRDSEGNTYSGFITNPYIGLIVSPIKYLDVSAGYRAHLVNGSMLDAATGSEPYFSNGEFNRFYAALMVKSPHEKVWLNLDFDISPQVTSNWSNGPSEASVGVSIGVLLEWKERKQSPAPDPVYFPEYKYQKEKQKKMADDLE